MPDCFWNNIWHATLGAMYLVGLTAGIGGSVLVQAWGFGAVPLFCLGANVCVGWANRLEATYVVFPVGRVRVVRRAGGSRLAVDGADGAAEGV